MTRRPGCTRRFTGFGPQVCLTFSQRFSEMLQTTMATLERLTIEMVCTGGSDRRSSVSDTIVVGPGATNVGWAGANEAVALSDTRTTTWATRMGFYVAFSGCEIAMR